MRIRTTPPALGNAIKARVSLVVNSSKSFRLFLVLLISALIFNSSFKAFAIYYQRK